MINYITWDVIGPETWALWLLGIAVAHFALARNRLQRTRRGVRFAVASLLVTLAFGATPLGSWLIRPLEARLPASTLQRAPASILVLGGAERLAASEWRGALEVNGAAERVIEGMALAHRFPQARLAIAGGITLKNSPLIDVMLVADAWQRMGVAPGRIVKIDRTADTCSNATGARDIRLPQPILLVTSAAHMPRAVACLRAAGIEPLIYPVDYRAIRPHRSIGGLVDNTERVDFALHEWIGLAWYRLRGRTAELYPAPR